MAQSFRSPSSDTSIPGEGPPLNRVWEPLKIGTTLVKNRIMTTAQTVLFGKDNILGDRHIEYYRERAKGGAALFICEQQAGHYISKGSFTEGCTAADVRAIPQFAKLADAVHEYGAKQFVQLFGAGVHDKGTTIFDEWHPLWGVSRIPSIYHHELPMVMERHHIAEIVEAFGKSAANVKVSGIDGVELQAAHSYLIGQFLSRSYNTRDDEYGGSVANRARVVIEIGEAIRKNVSADFTFGVRLSYDELIGPAGITAEETDETLELLARTGLFDFFNISAGGYHTLFRVCGPTGSQKGEFLPFGKRAKSIVGNRAKVFIVGRITTMELAERALAEGAGDMIAMTRAMMADPYHVKKSAEGRGVEIVHCVGANECANRALYQRPVTCAVNPAVGREAHWRKDNLKRVEAGSRKRIVVVGGGPAGMHAAQMLGKRGHSVCLLERQRHLGGHLLPWTTLPRWKEWSQAIDDMARELTAANVEVRLGTDVTAALLTQERPDATLIACGSRWDIDGVTPYRPGRERIAGKDQSHVMGLDNALNLLNGNALSTGKHVVIHDETGSYPPLALAEALASAGNRVTVFTPRNSAGEDIVGRGELFLVMPKLLELGVNVYAQTTIDSIDGQDVIAQNIWGGAPLILADISLVVMCGTRTPNDDLYREVREELPEVTRVGDCLAPRTLVQIMYEAEQIGRSL